MFKKGQLVKILHTGELAVISFMHRREYEVYFAKSLTESYLTVLHAQDIKLIGNNFKFKGGRIIRRT